MTNAQQLTLPPVGTKIRFNAESDIGRSADGITRMARVTFDEQSQQWVIASRLNQETMRWVPIKRGGRVGLMVFLNESPLTADHYLTVTAIQKSGKAVYADPGI